MSQISWVHVVVALIGGGSAGAIINALISGYRARLQPVGRRVEILPVFIKQSENPSGLTAEIAIAHNDSINTFKNLYLAEILVVNRGNKDLNEFKFGVTLSGGDRCIFIVPSAPDRHHKVLQDSVVTPQSPQDAIDFTLSPFNRKDSYSFKMYIVILEGAEQPNKIVLGSSSPVRFTDMPTVRDILTRAVENAVNVGPISIYLRR